MVQLSAQGWRHFQTLNALFENAQLKGQKAKATDIVNKGKPVLKQWQMKPLCSLSTQDQNFLLEKVSIINQDLHCYTLQYLLCPYVAQCGGVVPEWEELSMSTLTASKLNISSSFISCVVNA